MYLTFENLYLKVTKVELEINILIKS